MNYKYQIEINEFQKLFREFKHMRIVLYGIGRYTATLMDGLYDFQIVGLMDKNPENVGKKVFGLPIIDMHTAEKVADMVVINTSETYWNVIYDRISDIKIPVYFKNGEKAEKIEKIRIKNPYGEVDKKRLDLLFDEAEVISFDFYDTLFMRYVCNPEDIFRLLERDIKTLWSADKSYVEYRKAAIQDSHPIYSLDELYINIERICGLSHEALQKIKEKEMELEKKVLFPRMDILKYLIEAIEKKKNIYIISDMYLPKSFYIDVCRQYKINISESCILLSNVLHKSKANGALWEYYTKEIVKGRPALHVGDNKNADIEIPKKYGVRTFYIPSAWELMSVSSLGEMACRICMDYDSSIAGCILKKIFANPFMMQGSDGGVEIKDNFNMGYVVFGPVILTFLLWLDQQRREDCVSNLVFMSRDGYFLKEDYEYLCYLLGKQPNCIYLGISRQLAMSVSVTTQQELLEYALMPYTGSIKELFEDRFGIKDVVEIPDKPIEIYLEEYKAEIQERLLIIRNNYLHYLRDKHLDENSAIVDLGFYGNNQRYLNRLIGKKLKGYYFNANLSDQNENTMYQSMKACFQGESDLTGKKSQVLKRMIFIESVLTAPYGMVKAVDEKGNFICAQKGHNQIYFSDKMEINDGIKSFIRDYVQIFADYDIPLNIDFVDWYYGFCMNGALELSDNSRKSFYNDNAMMNRIESMLFY